MTVLVMDPRPFKSMVSDLMLSANDVHVHQDELHFHHFKTTAPTPWPPSSAPLLYSSHKHHSRAMATVLIHNLILILIRNLIASRPWPLSPSCMYPPLIMILRENYIKYNKLHALHLHARTIRSKIFSHKKILLTDK